MFTLLYDQLNSELSLLKQAYEKGGVQWIRKLPGVFDNIDGVTSIEQDYDTSGTAIVNNIYVAPRLSTNSWHLYKIDVSGAVPRQMWHSYRDAAAA